MKIKPNNVFYIKPTTHLQPMYIQDITPYLTPVFVDIETDVRIY